MQKKKSSGTGERGIEEPTEDRKEVRGLRGNMARGSLSPMIEGVSESFGYQERGAQRRTAKEKNAGRRQGGSRTRSGPEKRKAWSCPCFHQFVKRQNIHIKQKRGNRAPMLVGWGERARTNLKREVKKGKKVGLDDQNKQGLRMGTSA